MPRKGPKSPKLKGQGRKARSSSRGPSAKKKRKGSSAKSRSLSPLSSKAVVEIDILSPAAMTNAYYICHNAPDCLEKRGFAWAGAKGGKKGKKGGKKKKRKKK